MKKRILCFGDSNTWGYNPESATRYQEEERWTGRIAQELGNAYAVVEEGMNGRTTAFADRIEPGVCGLDYGYSCLISQFPLDVMIVMLGTNDVKDRYHVNAVEIGYGLDELLIQMKETCKRKGQTPQLIVVSPAKLLWKDDWIEFSQESCRKVDSLAKEYELIARQHGAIFMDASEVVKDDGIGCDGIHFSREGHRRFAEGILQIIKGK